MGRRQGRAKGSRITAFVSVVGVDDARAYAKKFTKLGGKITEKVAAVPGIGWAVYGLDPEGNLVGMFQDDTSAK